MTESEFETGYGKDFDKWVAVARRQLAKTPALRSETPEDAVQYVVTKMLKNKRHESMAAEDLGPYIIGALKNQISHLVDKSINEMVRNADTSDGLALARQEPDALALVEYKELEATVREVIQSFEGESTRRFLEMVYLEGSSQADAEEALGLRSMKSTCSRFRARVAAEIEG